MTATNALIEAYARHSPSSVARFIENADPTDAAEALSAIDKQLAASVLRTMAPASAAHLLASLPSATAAGVAAALGPHLAASLLRKVDAPAREHIVAALPKAPLDEIVRLLESSPNTAAALADPGALALRADHTVAEARAAIVVDPASVRDVVFIVDDSGALTGMITLADLVAAPDAAQLRKLCKPAPAAVSANARADEVMEHVGWRDHVTLPVVDHQRTFIGAIRYVDLLDTSAVDARRASVTTARTGRALAELYGLGFSGLVEWAAEAARGDHDQRGSTR